jgi:hypothetical protein
MRFAPVLRNDFADFIACYYSRCRELFGNIEAIAGKWKFEDLIPCMSDFDSRFICSNNMDAGKWCQMSSAVGQIHLELCRSNPRWARILEHLPGVNLTWDELFDELTYYPEYKQWTFYHSSSQQRQADLQALYRRPWDDKDEYFHLKKFIMYYGRYSRTIDPPINMGVFENKYPLHSRFMHYFVPPVQSAVSIICRRSICGKIESIKLASEIFPNVPIWRELLDAVEQHYELPELYDEPALTHLEDRLEESLQIVAQRLAPELSLIKNAAEIPVSQWRDELKKYLVDPMLAVFDNAKFARLMKGRLWFYTHSPVHFDSRLCIEIELKRMGVSFFKVPFGIFWQMRTGKTVSDPLEIVQELVPDLLSTDEAECVMRFARLTPGTWEQGKHVEIANEIVAVYDGFFRALHRIAEEVKKMQKLKY